ncbi:hypothetical protein C6P41_002782 [Kluyveromyces marxianus]|nr:hypothetical protein C6P43_000376 [Kluyveromyces marxianus]KAG0683924.1 hypothetical protein C6P41_002782 [Kluyveromyces marxianus]
MDFIVNSQVLLRKYINGYSISISEDQSLVCLWNTGSELEIYRSNGGYLINKVGNKEQNRGLIDVRWFGTQLFCNYNNGSVLVYEEGRELVRQLTFMPKGTRTKCIFYDYIQLEEDRYSMTEGALLKYMPKLNKWDTVKNQLDNELILGNDSAGKGVIDVFASIDAKTNKLVLSIEGTLNIKLGDKLKLPKDINRLMRVSLGKFLCMNKASQYQIVNLTFLQDQNFYKLIKTTQEYGALMKYLKQLHRHIGMKLVDPYFQFVDTLWKEAHRKALQELFYVGITDPESMQELHEIQLQSFRIEKWQSLSMNLCSNSISLIVSCMLPLLERMVVLAATIEALCEAITLISFPEEKGFTSELRQHTLRMLKSLRAQTAELMKVKKSHNVGFEWIQVITERLSKMEKDRRQTSSSSPATTGVSGPNGNSNSAGRSGGTTESSASLKKRLYLSTVEDFLTSDMVPQNQYEWVKNTFPREFIQTQTEFDRIMRDYTLRWLKKQISAEYEQPKFIELEDTDYGKGDYTTPICDVQIIQGLSKLPRALFVTPIELILVNLETQKIESRCPTPLPSTRLASAVTALNSDLDVLRNKAAAKPRLQLIPVKNSVSLPTTLSTYYLMPLRQIVTVTPNNDIDLSVNKGGGAQQSPISPSKARDLSASTFSIHIQSA